MKKTRHEKPQVFSLRFRLVLLVALEMVVSILLALWLGDLLDHYILTDWEVPLLV